MPSVAGVAGLASACRMLFLLVDLSGRVTFGISFLRMRFILKGKFRFGEFRCCDGILVKDSS